MERFNGQGTHVIAILFENMHHFGDVSTFFQPYGHYPHKSYGNRVADLLNWVTGQLAWSHWI